MASAVCQHHDRGEELEMARKPHPETCERCPNRYSKTGCPCWIRQTAGFIESNIVTKEERFITGCFYEVMPKLFCHVIAASNRPAAAVEDMRNRMDERMQTEQNSLGRLIGTMQKISQAPILSGNGEMKQIEAEEVDDG